MYHCSHCGCLMHKSLASLQSSSTSQKLMRTLSHCKGRHRCGHHKNQPCRGHYYDQASFIILNRFMSIGGQNSCANWHKQIFNPSNVYSINKIKWWQNVLYKNIYPTWQRPTDQQNIILTLVFKIWLQIRILTS